VSDRQTSDEGARKNTPSDYRVIEEPIFWRRSRSVELTPTPPPDKPEPVRRPAKVARQLALAHHLQAAIERGLVADQAALARKLGLTRARVTQLFDLLMLAADLQEQVLALEAVDGAEPMAERTLREVAHAGTWAEQRAAWWENGRHRPVRAQRTRLERLAEELGITPPVSSTTSAANLAAASSTRSTKGKSDV
jgi:transcriptional regulator with XRE-family HTH domain